MLQLTTKHLIEAERRYVGYYKRLLTLYRLTVRMYQSTGIANAGWLLQMVNANSGTDPISSEVAICYLLSLYSLGEGCQIHDCYSKIDDPGFLHFAKTCTEHNLLDGI